MAPPTTYSLEDDEDDYVPYVPVKKQRQQLISKLASKHSLVAVPEKRKSEEELRREDEERNGKAQRGNAQTLLIEAQEVKRLKAIAGGLEAVMRQLWRKLILQLVRRCGEDGCGSQARRGGGHLEGSVGGAEGSWWCGGDRERHRLHRADDHLVRLGPERSELGNGGVTGSSLQLEGADIHPRSLRGGERPHSREAPHPRLWRRHPTTHNRLQGTLRH